MTLLILFLQASNEVETAIEHAIQGEANNIEGEEVKVQSFDGFATIVDPDLWIEGHRPGRKVNPSKNNRSVDKAFVLCHRYSHENVIHATTYNILDRVTLFNSYLHRLIGVLIAGGRHLNIAGI